MKEQETEYGFIKNNKVVLKAWGANPDREIGDVKEDNPEASLTYFEERFQELEGKVSELEKIIGEATNKGSFLMKLMHMKELVQTHEGLGDYQGLWDRLQRNENLIQDLIAQNRVRNAEIKKALIEEVAVAADKINWKEATADIHDIKTRWIKTGNAPEGENTELEEKFWEIVSGFFDKKKAFYEDKKRLGEKNKSGYEQLVKEAAALSDVHGKERFEKVKDLKQRWSELGNIPKEDYAPLIDQFTKSLKPAQKAPTKKLDIKPIIEELDGYISGKEKPDMKALEEHRNILKAYRPNDYASKLQRKEAFNKIQLLKEKDFVSHLARKRFKDYKDQNEAGQLKLQIKLLHELLSRDREDLNQYLENSEKFSSASGTMNPMVEKKLNQQKTKVAVKEQLLDMLKKG
ncbi:MAG: DUF349 domain-containing protein [Cyclobacteriaceae bacterium]